MTIQLPARGHITHDPAMQCAAPGCPLIYRAHGYCATHYKQAYRRRAAEDQWAPPPTRTRVTVRGIVRWKDA